MPLELVARFLAALSEEVELAHPVAKRKANGLRVQQLARRGLGDGWIAREVEYDSTAARVEPKSRGDRPSVELEHEDPRGNFGSQSPIDARAGVEMHPADGAPRLPLLAMDLPQGVVGLERGVLAKLNRPAALELVSCLPQMGASVLRPAGMVLVPGRSSQTEVKPAEPWIDAEAKREIDDRLSRAFDPGHVVGGVWREEDMHSPAGEDRGQNRAPDESRVLGPAQQQLTGHFDPAGQAVDERAAPDERCDAEEPPGGIGHDDDKWGCCPELVQPGAVEGRADEGRRFGVQTQGIPGR